MVTVLTRTIGPSGRDYASFTLAEADVTNIGTSADLVANDEAIVFEADAGTYNESVNFSSTLTTDATRQVTYRPASGAGHDGVFESGVDLTGMIQGSDDHTAFEDIQFSTTATTVNFIEGKAVFFRRCLALINSGHYSLCFVRNATQTEPVSFIDCVFKFVSGTNGVAPTTANASLDAATRFINCTVIGTHSGSTGAFRSIADGSNTATIEIVNCIVLTGGACYSTHNPGTHTVTGSNNFGGSTNPFPAAIQGSPYPITPSTAYDPGAGDFALYVGKNGALLDSPNNDVIDQGVGPSANSDVPTTDILGNARSGAAANPGAFEQPQATATITKTIGPSGRDYTTFTLAEADVTNIGGSADLVNENERIVFEADAGSYNERLLANSTLTTDATRNVTYKAAAGSEHDGSLGSGVYLNGAFDDVAQIYDAHVNLIGLTISATGYSISAQTNSHGLVVDSCVVYSSATLAYRPALNVASGNAASPTKVTNTVLITDGIPYCTNFYGDVALRNCTTIGGVGVRISAGTKNIGVEVTNHLSLGSSSYQAIVSTGSITLSGSNNFGGATNPFPVAIQGSPYPITATTSFSTPLGSGDYAVYMGATGALADVTGNDVWQQGVGPASNSDVPTTDINGVTRSGTSCNPGAFEADGFVAPTVITKTIAASGADYATFTLAEAAVTSIGSGTDLTFYNEAIVFEADAGTYDAAVSQVVFNSPGLVTDPTRNITYKAAAGAQHGGSLSAGVIISAGTLVYDDFTTLEELVFFDASGAQHTAINGTEGITYRSCLGGNPAGNTCFDTNGSGSALYPTTYENCVGFGQASAGSQRVWQLATYSGDLYARFVNCTCVADGRWTFIVAGSTANTFEVEIVNFLSLGESLVFAGAYTDPARTYTGSNNFGGSSSPFPAALQGSPYPITATTDTDPGAGDWAIYETATGTLVFDSDNDVLLGGIGPDSNSDVPTTDIVGNTRSGTTADPGAFQVSPAGIGAFGIETDEAFGSPTLDATITVTAGRGIVSAEAFGTALIAGADLVVTGIASAEVFGRPALEAGTQFRLEFQRDSNVVDVMTHVDAPLTTLTGQDRPIPGMVHTINYYAQHLGWSSDQTAASDEPSPYGGDKITVIVPPPRGDGATP